MPKIPICILPQITPVEDFWPITRKVTNYLLVDSPNGHPASIPNGRRVYRDVLDIAVLKDIEFTFNMYSMGDLDSDHLPVVLHLEGVNITLNTRARHKVSWGKFRQTLSRQNTTFPPPGTVAEGDRLVSTFTESVVDACDNATSTVPVVNRNYYELPEYITCKIKRRQIAMRLWHSTGLRSYRQLANRLRREIRRNIRDYSNVQWNDKLMSLTPKITQSGTWFEV
ncbi:hypothetical protein JGB62_24270 [Salmonella enterica subsp. enterica serovar Give]|nr:hypothetical protein [Salmonella enterica subsp. enterica serovar Give]